MPKVTVQLVSWNGAKYIPYLLSSLAGQTYKDFQLLVWDNHSTDGTVSAIQEATKNFPVPVTITESEENLGFAKGHNRLYAKNTSPYILLLNQDMYLTPTCIEELVAGMENHPEAAAVTPRLMRWDFARIAEKDLASSLSHDIDAIGLRVLRNRRVVEQFTKEPWVLAKAVLPPHEISVFGVSGAFPLYRRSALEAVAYADGTFFDESYVAYKEDVDLAYRLQSAGFSAFVLLDCIAYHDRAGAGARQLTDLAALINKQDQSRYVAFHSYKNHLRTLFKNEYWQNALLDFPYIMWYEIKKFVYFLFFDKSVLKGLGQVILGCRDMCSKRLYSRRHTKVSWRVMRQWWSN
jgi:GT2 family glycosyltransferase